MNEDIRPNPDELLKALKREEEKKGKGRLKIFLGMCAGVGKTYAMLEEAHKMKKMGLRVAVGVINTHDRKETEELVEGLDVVPPKEIVYKDNIFYECDLDAVLQKKPDLILVDELAHTNVPGVRHVKRWQDVAELLDQGIDVFTTLNVQHIESLKDIVEDVTGIVVRETVPDQVISQAAFVILIDLTVDELLARLKEGKVYLGDQSRIAAENFFQENKLTALRELVLRYTAEKIDYDLNGMVSQVAGPGEWRPRERLLVCVSHSPHSQKLIRATRRLAFTLNAPWIALHIDDGIRLSEEDISMLNKNIALARDLGAEIMTIADPDVSKAIQTVARRRAITQIIIGRTPKGFFSSIFSHFPLLDKLVFECSDIDIHVIRQTTQAPSYRKKKKTIRFPETCGSYLIAGAAIALLSFLNSLISQDVCHMLSGFIFLSGILSLSLFLSKGPIFFASLLSAVIWDFFYIPPIGSFAIPSAEDRAVLMFYLLIAGFVGITTDKARKNRGLLLKQEATSRALYEIVRDIASAPTTEHILQAVKKRVGRLLDGTCDIIVKSKGNGYAFDRAFDVLQDEKEKAAAYWVLENGKEAGWSTATLPSSKHLFLPLKGFSEIVGVLAYQSKTNVELSIDEKEFLYAVGKQLANYLERYLSEEKQHKIDLLNQIEKIYQAVLDQLSNQFQVPLRTIQSAIDELKEEKGIKENKVAGVALYCIENSSGELIRAIKNATIMTRLSKESLSLDMREQDVSELIVRSSERALKAKNGHRIARSIQGNLPPIKCDAALLEILLENLLFNALEYSPKNSLVEIEVKRHGNMLVISIADEGKGIPESMLHSIFEKFYKLPGTSSLGLGLGLSIAKTIAELHNGTIKAENRKTGGTKISLSIPIN